MEGCPRQPPSRFQQHGIGANLVAMSVDGLNFSADPELVCTCMCKRAWRA